MSLLSFQRALGDLIASPNLCLLARSNFEVTMEHYQLSDREQRRLRGICSQRGMAVNCTLYRSNRITPLYTLMPLTCEALGDNFFPLVCLFWESNGNSDLQYHREIQRFGEFLQDQLAKGELDHPILEEVVNYELAVNCLRFISSKSHEDKTFRGPGLNPSARLCLHPMLRLVRFKHNPVTILEHLSQRTPLPSSLNCGDFDVLLDIKRGELEVKLIDRRLAVLLQDLLDGRVQIGHKDVAELLEEGFAAISS